MISLSLNALNIVSLFHLPVDFVQFQGTVEGLKASF